jgi:hypothetical protein
MMSSDSTNHLSEAIAKQFKGTREDTSDFSNILGIVEEDEAVCRTSKWRQPIVSQKDKFGRIPLHYALIYHATLKVVKRLHESWPESISVTDRWGDLKIHTAIRRKCSLGIVEYLAVHNYDSLDAEDCQGLLPLHIALQTKAAVTIVRYLIDCFPASVGRPMKPLGWLPLSYSLKHLVEHLSSKLFVKLIEHTPRHLINTRRDPEQTLPIQRLFMQTPLWTEENQVTVLEHLIGDYDGWDQHGEDLFGRSLMHLAALYKCSEGVVALILQIAPKTIMERDKDGRLPLHVAIQRRAPLKSILLLLEAYPNSAKISCGLSTLLPIELVARYDTSYSPIIYNKLIELNGRDATVVSELLSMTHKPFRTNEHEAYAKEKGHSGVSFEAGQRIHFQKQVSESVLPQHLESFKSYVSKWRQ